MKPQTSGLGFVCCLVPFRECVPSARPGLRKGMVATACAALAWRPPSTVAPRWCDPPLGPSGITASATSRSRRRAVCSRIRAEHHHARARRTRHPPRARAPGWRFWRCSSTPHSSPSSPPLRSRPTRTRGRARTSCTPTMNSQKDPDPNKPLTQNHRHRFRSAASVPPSNSILKEMQCRARRRAGESDQ